LKQKEREKPKEKEKRKKHKEHERAHAANKSSSDESSYKTATVFSHCNEAIYLAPANNAPLNANSLSNITSLTTGTFDDSDYLMMARVDPLEKMEYDKCSVSWTKANTKNVAFASITIAPFT
jgi:hypothetical protein